MGEAVAGHKYALILVGKVHWIFTAAQMASWNDKQATVVDITSITPEPEVGWTYSGGAFAAPSAPVLSWTQYRLLAQQALHKSDVTVLRCVESGVSVPAAWKAYREALRAIVAAPNGTVETLPPAPAFPKGT
jgi:hypothetical protein